MPRIEVTARVFVWQSFCYFGVKENERLVEIWWAVILASPLHLTVLFHHI